MTSLSQFLITTTFIICDLLVTSANQINANDLHQEESEGLVISDIFHSNFWTSKEIKVMTKNIFSYGALLVNASYGNLMVIDRNILRILLGSPVQLLG